MGLILPAIIGASTAFAQQPTLDKLKLVSIKGGAEYKANPINNQISGAVVIPATYNGKPVSVDYFTGCKEITSVTIPAGAQFSDVYSGFQGCTKLTSVTFQGSDTIFSQSGKAGNGVRFQGDLSIAYQTSGAGTYTRPAGGTNWTKQGGAMTPAQQPAAQYPLAQQAALDKLKFTAIKNGAEYKVNPMNNQISGAVVIPATYNGKPVSVDYFTSCKEITSVTIPAGAQFSDVYSGFQGCTKLTSVTFQGSDTIFSQSGKAGNGVRFQGDLSIVYQTSGAGTYTRSAGGTNWTKVQ